MLTTAHAIALGGHFYSSLAYSATLRALVAEHFLGSVLTNESHTLSPLLLFKAMASLAAEVVGNGKHSDDESEESYLPPLDPLGEDNCKSATALPDI